MLVTMLLIASFHSTWRANSQSVFFPSCVEGKFALYLTGNQQEG